MPKEIKLVVCSDTGNTTTLIKVVEALQAKDPTQSIRFLIIGVAAKKIFDDKDNAHHKDNVIVITDWLTKTTLEDLNNRSLTDTERKTVETELAKLKPEYSIVGSSSFPNAKIPYQIIEILTKQKQLLLAEEKQQSPEEIYVGDFVRIGNFDFFQDTLKNPLWSLLDSKWTAHISFLLAFAEEAKRMMKVNERLTCHAVSSPELDEMFEAKFDEAEIQRTLQKLGVLEEERLLFISGSTFIEDDLALLQVLHFDLRHQAHTKVRMGLHPGTDDMQGDVNKLLAWLEQHSDFPLRIIIQDAVQAKLSAVTLQNKRLLLVNVSGNEMFRAAKALAAPKPSTLATKGVILGLPTYCLTDYARLSYAGEFFKSIPRQLIDPGQTSQKLTRNDLGLPEEPAVEAISKILLGRR